MEARIKELGVILKKAVQITPKSLPEKRKKLGFQPELIQKLKLSFCLK